MQLKGNTIEDVVRALGYLTLGSRLKRLGEQLQLQAQPLLDEGSRRVSAAHYPLLAALERQGPLGAAQIAVALGVRQPGVTRALEKLKVAGLVKAARPTRDRRERPMALTRAGRQLVSRSRQHIWPHLEAAVFEACGPDGSLLGQLHVLEQALEAVPLSLRAARLAARRRSDASA